MKRMKKHKVKKEKPETTAYDRVLQEHDLAYYIHDRVELMHQVFSVIKAKDLRSMAPESVRRVSIDDLQELCTEELLGISSKRLCAILDGAEPPSDTESSSRSRSSSPPMETISLDSISSDDDMLSQASKRRKKKRRNSKSKPKKDKTKSKKDIPEGPAPPPELADQSRASRAGLTVLELLELQARARAIRAQLQQEHARKALEPAAESVVADDDDEDVEIKEEQPEVVEISSEEDEKPDVNQLDKANETTSKQTEPTVNGKEKATEVAGKSNENAETTEKPNKNAEKKKKDKSKKKKKDKESDKSKEDNNIAKTAEVNTDTNKEVDIATTNTSNELNAILNARNKETATTSTDNDVITIAAETLPEINKETAHKVTKRVNDLIITVPQQISRKIKLNRSKMTVSVANTENGSPTDRSVTSVTDNVPRVPENVSKVSSVVTIPPAPERLSSIVTKPDVRTKLNEIRQRKNNTQDQSIEKDDSNTVQDKTGNQANVNIEKEKKKDKDKPKKAKKRVKRKSTTDKENASDQDEITLQLSDSEKMDLLEDLDRKQYDKVSSTEESDSSSSTESDSDNDTVNTNASNVNTSHENNDKDTEKPTSPEFANKTDMIKDGTIAIEVIEVNNFYAGIEEFDKENEMAKTDENVQENDRNDEGEVQKENTQEKMVHVDENSRDDINKEIDDHLTRQDKEDELDDDMNKEIDETLKAQDDENQDKEDESEDSAESSDSDGDSKSSQSSDDSEHDTRKNDVTADDNEQKLPGKDDLGDQGKSNEKETPVNTNLGQDDENNEKCSQLYEDIEEIPEKQVTFLKENQNLSENIAPEAKISVTTERLGYISIDKETETNNIEISDIFDIPVINDEATCANENDICSDENRVQSDVAEVTENPQATENPEVIENFEVDKLTADCVEPVEKKYDRNETELTNNMAKETVEMTDGNKHEDIENLVTEVILTEVGNTENIERVPSAGTSAKTVSVEVTDKAQVSVVEVSDKTEERDPEMTEKEKERELSEGEVSTAESSEVEAMEWKPEVVCISDEDEKEPVAPKKKKKKEKKLKKDKKEKKSKKNKSDFRESDDQNFYTQEKVILDEINAVIDEIIDDKGHLIKEVKQDVIVIDKGDVQSCVEKPIKDPDTISLGSNEDVYEILDSDDSSCYEVEGTVLSKEPTADEIAALSAKIDEIERDDIITDEQIEEHERMLRDKDKGEENLTEKLKVGEFDANTEEDMAEKGKETDKNTENMTEKAKENEFYKTTDYNNKEEENVENVSWKDRYLGSNKVKKVLTTSNIFNALRKKNKELKKKLEQSKIKEAEELQKQEEKLKEAPVIEETLLEEGSIEHYNTLQGSTKYVHPVPDPEELKKAEEEKKNLEETQKNLEGTEQNTEVRIKNVQIEVTGEMKKDAKQLLKIYKKLLKYNDITKKKDPNKVKKKKKKSKKKDGGNVSVSGGAMV